MSGSERSRGGHARKKVSPRSRSRPPHSFIASLETPIRPHGGQYFSRSRDTGYFRWAWRDIIKRRGDAGRRHWIAPGRHQGTTPLLPVHTSPNNRGGYLTTYKQYLSMGGRSRDGGALIVLLTGRGGGGGLGHTRTQRVAMEILFLHACVCNCWFARQKITQRINNNKKKEDRQTRMACGQFLSHGLAWEEGKDTPVRGGQESGQAWVLN